MEVSAMMPYPLSSIPVAVRRAKLSMSSMLLDAKASARAIIAHIRETGAPCKHTQQQQQVLGGLVFYRY